MRFIRSLVISLAIFSAVLFAFLIEHRLLAGGLVNSCSQAELESALNGGGTVTFACDGTITLSNTITICVDTLLDATGHIVTISGNQAVRVFAVNPGVNFMLVNLVIANGFQASTNSNCGGGVFNNGGTFTATRCTFARNQVGTTTVNASAFGGALCNSNGAATLVDCSFHNNLATGGNGVFPGDDVGKDGYGGAVCNFGGTLMVTCCSFYGNTVQGGFGPRKYFGANGTGGLAFGGAILNTGSLLMTNSTLATNVSVSGYGSPNAEGFGAAGFAAGGGVSNIQGTGTLDHVTIASNTVVSVCQGSCPPIWLFVIPAYGGGVYSTPGSLTLINSIVSSNLTQRGSEVVSDSLHGNCYGSIIDGGHNISSDGSCPFTTAGSLTNTDAMLGPFGNYEGATLVFPLLEGSPAINTGDQSSSLATDQRGFPQPIGLAPDIGAYEYGSPAFLRISPKDDGFDILVTGKSGQTCRLQASETLLSWQSIATNQFGVNGTALFHEAGGSTQRFYQAFVP